MTQMPPDLSRPYDSDRDRMADRANLTDYWYALEPLVILASVPSDDWPERARNLIASFSAASRTADPADRLRRWSSLYGEEIALVRDARNRVVHGEIITDPELLGATWLARQVLATLAGIPPGQVDQDWVRSVAAQATVPKALAGEPEGYLSPAIEACPVTTLMAGPDSSRPRGGGPARPLPAVSGRRPHRPWSL